MAVKENNPREIIRPWRKSRPTSRQRTQTDLVLRSFGLTAFLVAGWFLVDAVKNESIIGIVVGGGWLVNIIIGSLFIHAVLRNIETEEGEL